ncbi:MAG: DUF2934 domain-containing protein [Verrucomicrobiota bacterium]|nr:DUF2934 domain-containing protein [Verrucomicrobiota bacterium]
MKNTIVLPAPSEAEIQKAAYQIWMENGCPVDRDLENWLAAKELVRRQHEKTTPRSRRAKKASSQPSAGVAPDNN